MILTDEELALAYRAVLNQSIRPQDKSVIFKYALELATIEAAILAKLNSAESILAKDNEALRAQIAELTKTNLAQAAQIDELNSVIGHAKQMEAMDKKTLAEQAAQIEMLTTAAINVVGPFIHAEQGSPIQILRQTLSTPPAPAPAPAPAPSAPSAPEPCVQCQSEYFRGWAEALEVAAKLCRNEAKLRLAQDILNLIER